MMENIALETIKILCISMMCGGLVCLAYDFLSIILVNLLQRKNRIVTFVLDTLAILAFMITFILLLYYACNGKFRSSFFIFMCVGVCIYIKVLRKICNKIIGFTVFPIKAIVAFFIELIKKTVSFLKVPIAKIRDRLYNKRVG